MSATASILLAVLALFLLKTLAYRSQADDVFRADIVDIADDLAALRQSSAAVSANAVPAIRTMSRLLSAAYHQSHRGTYNYYLLIRFTHAMTGMAPVVEAAMNQSWSRFEGQLRTVSSPHVRQDLANVMLRFNRAVLNYWIRTSVVLAAIFAVRFAFFAVREGCRSTWTLLKAPSSELRAVASMAKYEAAFSFRSTLKSLEILSARNQALRPAT